MKKFFLLIVILQLLTLTGFTQGKIRVKTLEGRAYRGYIVDIDSVNLKLAKRYSNVNANEPQKHQTIPITTIQFIELERKSKAIQKVFKFFVILIGGAYGAATGYITGAIFIAGTHQTFDYPNHIILITSTTVVASITTLASINLVRRKPIKTYSIYGHWSTLKRYIPEIKAITTDYFQ